MDLQIGWIIQDKDEVVCNNSFECAAWYENIAIKAGRYPLKVLDAHIDDDGRVRGHIGFAYYLIPGTIVSDNFQSLFCGMPIGKSYDGKQNAGKPTIYHSGTYMYNVAESIVEDRGEYELLPEFEARAIDFISCIDGEKCRTHGIFKKEANENEDR